MNRVNKSLVATCSLAACFTLVSGCEQFMIDSADSIATHIIRNRQKQAIGQTTDVALGPEEGHLGPRSSMYDFVPHPIDSDVPEPFRANLQPAPTTQPATQPVDVDLGTNGEAPIPEEEPGEPFTLAQALAYSFHHAREYQTQKEDLYLAALALMTERQLWTPQVVGQISAQYANYGQVRDFDQAMTAVAELSATQRLPYGGEVAARVVNTLMRDIGRHITSGESGATILEANIPLLRGAGRVAFESRYQAERELIYAIRQFERFRRGFVVQVAGDFFDLLVIKTQIDSAADALEKARYDLDRSQAFADVGRVLQVEADRARVQVLDLQNELINARVRYQTELDRFKIRIGMPTTNSIDAVESDLDLSAPEVSEAEAIATALQLRLDLLNTLDFIGDAQRAVVIAKNNFLPQLDVSGQVSMTTKPEEKNSFSYNTERTLWQAFVDLELPIDRREERNVFRASLIDLRRAERNYDLAQDTVRLEVRSAMRNVELARDSIAIQEENVRVNSFREQLAREQFDKGKLLSNRDVFEAQRALQLSLNQLAAAIADYRLAVLTFLRDTGTLRVDDEGHWVR